MKPFDPDDVDETLTRVVVHGEKTHLLFPFLNATGNEPKYTSIGMPIPGAAATVEDFRRLSLMIKQGGKGAVWRIVFNTPWLVRSAVAEQRLERRPRS